MSEFMMNLTTGKSPQKAINFLLLRDARLGGDILHLSSTSSNSDMHRKDSGASGTRDHGDVEAFEAMSDLRGDRFFRLVESGTDSTEHCPRP
jgi:hypothetical protein